MSMPEPTDIVVDDPALAAVMPIIEHPECTCHFVDIGVGYQKVDEDPDCPRCTPFGLAGAVLTALAKAGLLLPPGGHVREEGGYLLDDGRIVSQGWSSANPTHTRRRVSWSGEGPNDNWPLYTGPWTEVQP